MAYRPHAAPQPLLFGYDPVRDLPADHLARLVDQVVDASFKPTPRPAGAGQPPFDPRLPLKVLVYGYCIGLRSSRRLEQACRENLAFLYLTRGDTPSYRTLCTARTSLGSELEQVWEGLFAVAAAVGLERVGRIVVDSTKLRADVSPEAVVKREEFAALRAELLRILAEAETCDTQEAAEGAPATTLGKTVAPEHMRDILRRVRRAQKDRRSDASTPAPDPPASDPPVPDRPDARPEAGTLPGVAWPDRPDGAPSDEAPIASCAGTPTASGLSPRMLQRVKAGLAALALAETEQLAHLALTDPAARMMGEGRERRVRECHAWEVAIDAGLLVAAQTMQENTDNGRLGGLVDAARAHEPGGVWAVDGDSGYYAGDGIAALALAGIDTCIPDSNTAGDLHRGQPVGTTRDQGRGKVPFTYDVEADVYRCPEANTLAPTQTRKANGQEVTVYRAVDPCGACPRAADCLTQPEAQHRTLKVGKHQALLEALRQRFNDPEHVARYHRRGDAVETVFGFLRAVLGYTRWQLRGAEKVACEGRLFAAAYQFRKVHTAQHAAARAARMASAGA